MSPQRRHRRTMLRALGIGGVVLAGERARQSLAARPPEQASAPDAEERPRPTEEDAAVPGYYDDADGFHPLL